MRSVRSLAFLLIFMVVLVVFGLFYSVYQDCKGGKKSNRIANDVEGDKGGYI